MPFFPRRILSTSTRFLLTKSFTTNNKGIFVPTKAWPALTQAGNGPPCKKCTALDKNHHGHLGIKELVDKKSMGTFVPNKCWPAQTKKHEDCKQCAKFTPGYFCHHHRAQPSASSLQVVAVPRPPLLPTSRSLLTRATHRNPRFYEIAALTTLATEFVSKTVSCSQ